MKIIYYELIKMLIDYERRNNPTAYDATKNVGKIDGYQELTNKLQRFLNQRFILDIQKLSKTCEKLPDKISDKVKRLEEEFSDMKTKHELLEERNLTLKTEVGKLKEREAELTKKIEIFESNELSLDESNRKLVEKVECIELDGKKLDDVLVQLKLKQESDMIKVAENIEENKINTKRLLECINVKIEAQEKVTKQIRKSLEHTISDHETKLSDIRSLHEKRKDDLENKCNQLFENTAVISKNLKENDMNLKSLNKRVDEHGSIFQKNNIEEMSTSIIHLEDVQNNTFVRIQEIDSMKRTFNCIEENRQQSIAKVNDEVSETKRNNLNQIENLRKDIDEKIQTLYHELKNDSSSNNERVNSLQKEVIDSIQSGKKDSKAAEQHLENLRLLNKNLIEQLKDKSAKDQDVFKEKIENNFNESLSNLKASLSCELESLDIKSSSSNSAISDLAAKIGTLSRQVTTLVGNEEKIKDIVNTLESNQRMDQNNIAAKCSAMQTDNENLELKISHLMTSQENHQKTTFDGLAVLRDSYDKHISQYENTSSEHSKLLGQTNEKLSAIMETASRLLSECAMQEKKMNAMEKHGKGLDKKITDLESAELFLQEAQKQVVERTIAFEDHIKSMENNWIRKLDKHSTELLSKITKIQGEKIDDINSVWGKKMKEYEEKQNDTEDSLSKVNIQITNLELSKKSMHNQVEILTKDKEAYIGRLDQLEPLVETFESKISRMENQLKKDIEELTSKSIQSKEDIQSSNENFETKINKAKDELKTINDEIDQQNQQIENLTKENAKIILEAKKETDCKKQSIEGMRVSLNNLETKLETFQSAQIIEVSNEIKSEYCISFLDE